MLLNQEKEQKEEDLTNPTFADYACSSPELIKSDVTDLKVWIDEIKEE